MTPTFTLPSGYKSREVEFVLAPANYPKRGWQFFGRDAANRYSTPARNSRGAVLCSGDSFATRDEAAMIARALGLPAYAVWNGRKRAFVGTGAKFTAHARDAVTVS